MDPQKILQSMAVLYRIAHQDIESLRTILGLIRQDDIGRYEDFFLTVDVADLCWEVVRSYRQGPPCALILRREGAIEFHSDHQDTLPVDVVEQVHDGIKPFMQHLIERFPFIRERCRPFINVASRLRQEMAAQSDRP